MNKKLKYWLENSLLIILLVGTDQVSKIWASKALTDGVKKVIIPKTLSFLYLNGGNDGAAFGILGGKTLVFVIFTVVACIFLTKFLNNINTAKSVKLNTANAIKDNYSQNPTVKAVRFLLIFLMAGAIGNFIDRVILGSVRDFIMFDFIKFPIFNVADIFITVSCILLFVLCLFKLNSNDFDQVFRLRKIKE